MHTEKKEAYVQPVLVKHELLMDITARSSGIRGTVSHGHGHHHDR
jgi:hypothetical protein